MRPPFGRTVAAAVGLEGSLGREEIGEARDMNEENEWFQGARGTAFWLGESTEMVGVGEGARARAGIWAGDPGITPRENEGPTVK